MRARLVSSSTCFVWFVLLLVLRCSGTVLRAATCAGPVVRNATAATLRTRIRRRPRPRRAEVVAEDSRIAGDEEATEATAEDTAAVEAAAIDMAAAAAAMIREAAAATTIRAAVAAAAATEDRRRAMTIVIADRRIVAATIANATASETTDEERDIREGHGQSTRPADPRSFCVSIIAPLAHYLPSSVWHAYVFSSSSRLIDLEPPCQSINVSTQI